MIATLTQTEIDKRMLCATKHICDSINSSLTQEHCTCLNTMIDLFRIMYKNADLAHDLANVMCEELQIKRVEIISNNYNQDK